MRQIMRFATLCVAFSLTSPFKMGDSIFGKCTHRFIGHVSATLALTMTHLFGTRFAKRLHWHKARLFDAKLTYLAQNGSKRVIWYKEHLSAQLALNVTDLVYTYRV